jgi:ATP-dependent exoDNAse (exonuclease V) beta subunit
LQGLLLALDDADPKRPPSLAADAIQVMTYHGAKGLEWPMTVLASLGWEPKARLFEPVAEADGELDWRKPLANRWIRFWPWPYGLAGTGGSLDAAAAASDLGQAAWRRTIQEETRLLYVGVTRARDYLIFAPPPKGQAWFGVLDEADIGPHLAPPAADDNLLTIGGETFVADVRVLAADAQPEQRYPQPAYVTARRAPEPRPPLFLRPSGAAGVGWRVVERATLGGRLPIDGVADMTALGEALHAILAYDNPKRDRAQRQSDAADILARWNVKGFAAADALTACDRLHTWLAARWPDAALSPEAPVAAALGDQQVQGRIDLLVRHAQGVAILDHKSFPGRLDQWDERALQYAPQVGLYAQAAVAASGSACDELWVHMPVVGAMLRVSREE